MDDIHEELRETIPFDQPAPPQGMNANAHRSQDGATSLFGN
jgi:hypothetical protein